MGMLRVNAPGLVLPGGVMCAGEELLTLEQLGKYAAQFERGEIGEDKLAWAMENACPSCGACSFIGTACTMQIMAEALGLALPGSALLPAAGDDIIEYARRAGAQAVALAEKGLRPKDILTMGSFENAILVHAAVSGSTNCLLHLPAIAHEAGLRLDADAFDRLHRGANGYHPPLRRASGGKRIGGRAARQPGSAGRGDQAHCLPPGNVLRRPQGPAL